MRRLLTTSGVDFSMKDEVGVFPKGSRDVLFLSDMVGKLKTQL